MVLFLLINESLKSITGYKINIDQHNCFQY